MLFDDHITLRRSLLFVVNLCVLNSTYLLILHFGTDVFVKCSKTSIQNLHSVRTILQNTRVTITACHVLFVRFLKRIGKKNFREMYCRCVLEMMWQQSMV